MAIPPEKIIKLTEKGDTLVIPRNKKEGDELVLTPDAIGWHKDCDGYIGLELKSSASLEYMLVCWVCHFHILVPSIISTYAELRAFLKKALEAPI